ncbi:hypothetical protein KL946_000373 [Ogataea haglerorum]|uniref:Mtf2-like C-terminal domain-containing protein n=1 Tax=Ogataea haglerorum TaxID=1937702 RepID=A0ABQ7RNB6_9ASCO|nr:hypothetical protein KL946_000373 [Ogataea haglerorum]
MLRARSIRQYSKLGQTVADATKSGVASSITNDQSYKNFFEDFSKSVMSQNQLSSISEQKTFGKVFDYLMKKTKPAGVAETLKDLVNINEQQAKSPFQDLAPGTQSIKAHSLETYKKRLEQKKALFKALEPALNYIGHKIDTSEAMMAYIKNDLVERFVREYSTKNRNSLDHDQLVQNTATLIFKNPSQPPVNQQTLPLLLEYCINSLTYDFDSFDDTLLLLDYIRQHKSIIVYEFGLNIDVYNSVLLQVWRKAENLQLISKLVDEISANAIQPDLLTYKILAQIYLQCMNVDDESKARYHLLWGNGSDIYKVRTFLDNMKLSIV